MKAWSPALSCLTGWAPAEPAPDAFRPAATSADIWILGISLSCAHMSQEVLAHLGRCRASLRPPQLCHWRGSGSVVHRQRLRGWSPPSGVPQCSHTSPWPDREQDSPVIFRYGGFIDANCSLLIDAMCDSEGSSLGGSVSGRRGAVPSAPDSAAAGWGHAFSCV